MIGLECYLGLSVILSLFTFPQLAAGRMTLDPGDMFSRHQPDYQEQPNQPILSSYLENLTEKPWFTDDSSCPQASDIVLKRILKKLFNQMHLLQPNELDHEFDYRSILTYADYISMTRILSQEKLDCSNLNKLDSLLSQFMTRASLDRPSQKNPLNILTELFSSTWPDITGIASPLRANNFYFTSLLAIVGLASWILNTLVGYSKPRSIFLALLIVGFVQFNVDKFSVTKSEQQQRLHKCLNPGLIARFLAFFRYDYHNCLAGDDEPRPSNVAEVTVEFLSRLALNPFAVSGEMFGRSTQAFLSSFNGLDKYLFGPVFGLALYLVVGTMIYYLICELLSHFWWGSSQRRRRASSPMKASLKGSGARGSSGKNRIRRPVEPGSNRKAISNGR